jgi:hypothetical protein
VGRGDRLPTVRLTRAARSRSLRLVLIVDEGFRSLSGPPEQHELHARERDGERRPASTAGRLRRPSAPQGRRSVRGHRGGGGLGTTAWLSLAWSHPLVGVEVGAVVCPHLRREVPRPGEARRQPLPARSGARPQVRSTFLDQLVSEGWTGSPGVVPEGEPRHPRRCGLARRPWRPALEASRGPNPSRKECATRRPGRPMIRTTILWYWYGKNGVVAIGE